MITSKRRKRHLPGQPGPFAATAAGAALTAAQLDELWAAYWADRAEWRLRNRLVEHYLPFVRNLATAITRKMRMRDKENAVGEVLASLVRYMVPNYDGRNSFDDWARFCTKRKLIDQRRAEHRVDAIFDDEQDAPFDFNQVLDREQRGRDLDFVEFTAELSDRQSAVVWLRYYRGLSVGEVAELLKVRVGTVRATAHQAIRKLQKYYANSTAGDFAAYH